MSSDSIRPSVPIIPMTAYEATIMYLDAVGIIGYREVPDYTLYTKAIELDRSATAKLAQDLTYIFDLNGSLIVIE